MELWQIGVGFGMFFLFGIAFSGSVFWQYFKEHKQMKDRIKFLETNMRKALSKLEWGGDENETIERESEEGI